VVGFGVSDFRMPALGRRICKNCWILGESGVLARGERAREGELTFGQNSRIFSGAGERIPHPTHPNALEKNRVGKSYGKEVKPCRNQA
jgi:hypothetical protein